MIAYFSYGTLKKQNASLPTDINTKGTTVVEPFHKKKKNIILISD